MTRQSIAAVVCGGVAVCTLTSCVLLNSHRLDAPPPGEREVAAWWAQKANTLPRGLLEVYVAASDAHARRGSSATYTYNEYRTTMANRTTIEVRLPSPPPDGVLGRMRERLLRDGSPSPGWSVPVDVTECRGCTPQEAAEVWQRANESVPRAREK